MALVGCTSSTEFLCRDDVECRNGRDFGQCESAGYCSFPDPSCTSERRFGELAPKGFAGQCVPPEAGDDGTSTGSTSLSSDEVTSPTTSEASTISGDPETTSAIESESSPASSAGVPDLGSVDETDTTAPQPSDACPNPGPGSLLDDFEDGVLSSPPWLTFACDSACDVSEGNGRLQLSVGSSGDVYAESLAVLENPVNMRGNHVRIDVAAFPQPVTEIAISLRLRAEYNGDLCEVLITATSPTDDETVVNVYSPAGNVYGPWFDIMKPFSFQIRFDENDHVFYEIRDEYSIEPVTFHDEPNPCPTDVFHVLLAAGGTHTEAAPITREIESFALCHPG